MMMSIWMMMMTMIMLTTTTKWRSRRREHARCCYMILKCCDVDLTCHGDVRENEEKLVVTGAGQLRCRRLLLLSLVAMKIRGQTVLLAAKIAVRPMMTNKQCLSGWQWHLRHMSTDMAC